MTFTSFKKGLALLCAAALLLTLCPGVLAYGTASDWAKGELDRMEDLGLIPPGLAEKESLLGQITRLEMCEISLHAFESYHTQKITVTDPQPFSDTDSLIAAKAYAAGLVSGYPDGTFRPQNTLTRQEFFAFVHKFLLAAQWQPQESDYSDLSQFSDKASVGEWALEATQLMVGIGVVQGAGGKLLPHSTTTCEQALIMFLRGYLVLTGQSLEPPTEPTPVVPIPTDPEPTDPEPTDPEPTDPEPTDPEPTDPEPTDPEPTDPEPTDPEPTDPEPTDPEPTDPEPTDPEPTDPEPSEYPGKYPNMEAWAVEELQPMEEAGLIPELLVGRDMTSPITRREVCHTAVLAFMSIHPDIPLEDIESPFTDTQEETIITAYYLGLINGYPDGTFRPDASITREQLFTVIGNFLNAAGYYRTDAPDADLRVFEDADQLHDYALPATRLLYSMGIVKGSGNRLYPQASTQCQQALAMFYRTYTAFETWSSGGDRPEAEELVAFALQFVGYPYLWGAEHPNDGFDCSGLVYYVYREFGYKIPRTATLQYNYTGAWEVPPEELLPGDLVFFSDSASVNNITHVGIYIGNDQFLHAANTKRGVVVDSVFSSYYVQKFIGARRIIP